MSLRPDDDGRRSLAARETSATSPAAAFAHLGGATLLVLSYLALIPGFLPAFILAVVLALVLLVPMLAIAAAPACSYFPSSPFAAWRTAAGKPTPEASGARSERGLDRPPGSLIAPRPSAARTRPYVRR